MQCALGSNDLPKARGGPRCSQVIESFRDFLRGVLLVQLLALAEFLFTVLLEVLVSHWDVGTLAKLRVMRVELFEPAL